MTSGQILSILLFTALSRLVVTVGMGIYAWMNRTFPGFRLWVAGSAVGTLGFLAVMLRSVAMGPSIVLSNLLLSLTVLLFFDGSCRFVQGRPLDRRWYLLSPALALAAGLAWYPRDLVLVRVWALFLVSAVVFVAHGLLWLRGGSPEVRLLYTAGAVLHFAYAAAQGARALAWTFGEIPSSLLQGGTREGVFFLAVGVMDLGAKLFYVIANSQRLEIELRASNAEVEKTLRDLIQTRAEDDLLSRILQICPRCRQIQDGQGGWVPLDHYVARRSHASLSHGLCPDCIQRLYPEDAEEVLRELRSEAD